MAKGGAGIPEPFLYHKEKGAEDQMIQEVAL
jgi:hypothetical protein